MRKNILRNIPCISHEDLLVRQRQNKTFNRQSIISKSWSWLILSSLSLNNWLGSKVGMHVFAEFDLDKMSEEFIILIAFFFLL